MDATSFQHLTVELRDEIALVGLNRPPKRNALNDGLIADIHRFFSAPPEAVKVAVLFGHGDHFCSGLDLLEHSARSSKQVMQHSQSWHRAFEAVQFGGLPVVSALHGAVIGGGLELACATHVRVAESSCFYGLPEGQRGIFVGGGGSVRIARILGPDRMTEMMLTGRSYDAEDGYRLGLSHYRVGPGEALDKALELARRIGTNAPLSTYAAIQALPRIADMSARDGLFTESLVVAMTQSSDEAQSRMKAFLESRNRG